MEAAPSLVSRASSPPGPGPPRPTPPRRPHERRRPRAGQAEPPKTATEIATGKAAPPGNVSWDAANQKWVGGKVMGQPMEGPAGYPDLYNFSDPALRQTPDVPQFDLPRYDPPRGVSQRVQDLIANPDVRSQMLEGMRSGMDVGMPWYNTQPAIQGASSALGGEDAGRAAFAKFQDFMGATSPRNPVPENMRAASYYYWRDANGMPPMAKGDPIPQPYGSFAQGQHQLNVQKLSEGGAGYDIKDNPKPPSFTQGLMGNYQPVAVDAHAFKAPAMMAQDPRFLAGRVVDSEGNVIARPKQEYDAGTLSMEDALKRPSYWESKPNPNEYPAMEQYYKGLSGELGIDPAQAQASGWVGNGPLTGLKTDDTATWLQLWQNRINNTAMRMGKSPQEVEQGFWQGQHPLLTGGGSPGPLMQQNAPPQPYDPNQWLQPGELGS